MIIVDGVNLFHTVTLISTGWFDSLCKKRSKTTTTTTNNNNDTRYGSRRVFDTKLLVTPFDVAADVRVDITITLTSKRTSLK